ncbi:MAG: transglutaminase-like domain-containing protein [Archangium sp.]|nr:transglutaminase-like domain-containing protein [Archangium sp.]
MLGLACLLASLGALRALDYSTSLISRGTLEEANSAPHGGMQIGDVRWDLTTYQTAPSLQAFRDSFSARCGSLRGVSGARCVTTLLLEASPHGPTSREFVDADFDPATAIRAHLAGASGNCTARSAMAATALLSLGIPARVVQMLPLTGRGHNVLEVWDETIGWVLFDPLYDSSYLVNGTYASAATLADATGGVTWRRAHDGAPDPNTFAGSTIQFPEPWLYTRVGERCAWWPFRGCFVQVGPEQFRYGRVQTLTHLTVVLAALFTLAWTLWWLRSRSAAERE